MVVKIENFLKENIHDTNCNYCFEIKDLDNIFYIYDKNKQILYYYYYNNNNIIKVPLFHLNETILNNNILNKNLNFELYNGYIPLFDEQCLSKTLVIAIKDIIIINKNNISKNNVYNLQKKLISLSEQFLYDDKDFKNMILPRIIEKNNSVKKGTKKIWGRRVIDQLLYLKYLLKHHGTNSEYYWVGENIQDHVKFFKRLLHK